MIGKLTGFLAAFVVFCTPLAASTILDQLDQPSSREQAYIKQAPAWVDGKIFFGHFLRDGSQLFAAQHTKSTNRAFDGLSGGSTLRKFKTGWLDVFFKDLFHSLITAAAQLEIHHDLSMTDLFHGHVYITDSPKDLLILFHAKEYPNDLPGYEKYKAAFSTASPFFRFRNMIYRASTHSFYFIDFDQDSPFFESYGFPSGLSKDSGDDLYDAMVLVKTFQEEYLLDIPTSHYIADINLIRKNELILAFRGHF